MKDLIIGLLVLSWLVFGVGIGLGADPFKIDPFKATVDPKPTPKIDPFKVIEKKTGCAACDCPCQEGPGCTCVECSCPNCPSKLEWVEAQDTGTYGLYRGERQVGYVNAKGEFRWLLTDTEEGAIWSAITRPPIAVPRKRVTYAPVSAPAYFRSC